MKIVKRILSNWMERHQDPVSFALHMVGIPMTIIAVGFLIAGWWLTALILFVGGYAIQFVGHAIEGNDAGELIVFKKMLGKPYVAVVPRDKGTSASTSEPASQ
ncbi:hypothetical protein Pan216_51330 [Planctomycetes bacterium Pan216]|uniref:DUF962 domain-containing protein n=1 Tax=Kolteria novifilia TaxID=2527975 RepID=A0A518BB81_9BACT|nr:hypothetical protein Pan216_51330 [Planctomycetes bacterium Pan216]